MTHQTFIFCEVIEPCLYLVKWDIYIDLKLFGLSWLILTSESLWNSWFRCELKITENSKKTSFPTLLEDSCVLGVFPI